MDWIELLKSSGLPTISSVTLLAGIGFLCRNWFIARITYSIKHEYDEDLELHKDKLRKETDKDLEKHKDNLRKETDSELTKLRGTVELEVEKAKLKFNLYSGKQFELYND
ncbi:hypothetical protein IMZ68_06195, partial [Candidatus Bathyarchaeota archaeon]|nr:hypothetical protein [Candidatus Bathyarchaeota archaeon]